MIKRFYKDKEYIGIDNHAKDTTGEWRNELSVHRFTGRPYSGKYAYDRIIEFSQVAWDLLIEKAEKQAIDSYRQVISSDTYIYLAPIFIHTQAREI